MSSELIGINIIKRKQKKLQNKDTSQILNDKISFLSESFTFWE